jgi:hypothetical protein
MRLDIALLLSQLPCVDIPTYDQASSCSTHYASASSNTSPLNLRTLHCQKLTQPFERFLRLRRCQMFHRLQQMRRNVLVKVDSCRTTMRYRLSWRAWMRAVARGHCWRLLWNGGGRGWCGLDSGLESGICRRLLYRC